MRTVRAGLAGTFVATVLGVGMLHGAALAAPGTPSVGDAGSNASDSVMDVLDALRSGHRSTTSTQGASY